MVKSNKESTVRFIKWEEMPAKNITDSISRKFLSNDQVTFCQFYVKKGTVAPKHAHENVQYTLVLKGAIRFRFGENLDKKFIVNETEAIFIPSNMPHELEFLEETILMDVFVPGRKDWLSEADSKGIVV